MTRYDMPWQTAARFWAKKIDFARYVGYLSPPMAPNRLRQLRSTAGLTITELAAESRVSVRTIQRVEAGDNRLRVTTLRKLYNALSKISPAQPMPEFHEIFPEVSDETTS